MKICIFEDGQFENLYPLTYLRPVSGLRCGGTLLFEKVARDFPKLKISFWVREYLAKLWKKEMSPFAVNDTEDLNKNDTLFINDRWLFGDIKFNIPKDEEIGEMEGKIIYAFVKKNKMNSISPGDIPTRLAKLKDNIPVKKIKVRLITYPWDLINHNADAIKEDFAQLDAKIQGEPSPFLSKEGSRRSGKGLGEFSPQASIYGEKEKVHISKGAKVYPMVVIDTTHGPVIIDEGAIIYPFTKIEGPSYIGKESQIHGAKIREGSSIGPVCRIGGEIEEAIIHGYSNKYHDGFLGHSYVGEWVNLGALTTNSDIKNDYSPVSVYIKGEIMNSGEAKIGSFIGDHTKTSIGTFLNTGTVIGVMTNLVGSGGVLPKFVPSFTWYLNKKFTKGYGFKMLLKTAEVAMSRRGKKLEQEELDVLKHVYEITKAKREELIERDKMGGKNE